MSCMRTRGVHRLHRSIFCGRCCCRCFTQCVRSGCWLNRSITTFLSAGSLPQYETDVECADVDQQTLQNVVMPAQGRAPHPTRLVTVGKAAFDEFSPPSE